MVDITKTARCIFAAAETKKRNKKESTYRDSFNKAYKDWSTFTLEKQNELVEHYTKDGSAPTPRGMPPLLLNAKPADNAADQNGLQYSPGGLLTWNGPWFLNDAAYLDLVQEWQQIPHLLVKHISRHPGISEFFAEFRNMILLTQTHFKLRDWSCCLEILAWRPWISVASTYIAS